MKYHNNIYIGRLIKQKFEEKGIAMSQFADAILCSRSNIYNIFKAKSIDIDKLILISDVLDYPFLEEYMLQKSSNTQIVLEIEFKNGKSYIKQIEEVKQYV
jgi:transcriptional regulator with XRE-family HTH domain